jgi:hypothetical protein
MKRRERYIKMFSGLGPKVRARGLGENAVDFESAVGWSMKHLRKDDRIVWFLSIIQRAALLRLQGDSNCNRRNIGRKIRRKLKGFSDDRVNADYESNFMEHWPHYESLEAIYQLSRMKDYPFHFKEENKLIPKPANFVLRDYHDMEERLQELVGSERFCSDGKVFLAFEDGWTWFEIEEGMSGQEARAMKHCGNGAGKRGDRLLSLREPIRKGEIVFWKPRLTFVLNHGSLGEMKGFANEKPNSCYHSYVEGLLTHPETEQIRGGGYLPENNFSFADLDAGRKKRVLEANQKLDFDPFGNEGEALIQSETHRWIKTSHPQFPESLPKLSGSETCWIAFQTPIQTSTRTMWVSHAWCTQRKGCVGPINLAQDDSAALLGPATVALLLLPELKQFPMGQDPLTTYSNWRTAMGDEGCCQLMEQKPAYFRYSTLKDLWNLAGLSHAYVSILNHRFGLGFRKTADGIELQRYETPRAFARQTLSRSYLNLPNPSDAETLAAWIDEPPFEVPWLRLKPIENRSEGTGLALLLTTEGAELFFDIMDFENVRNFTGIVPEIIYRFGLRTSPTKSLSAAA